MAKKKDPDMLLVSGINPVREAVRTETYRPREVLVDSKRLDQKGQIDWIVNELGGLDGGTVRATDRKELDKLAGGANHQGIVARVPAFAYADPESFPGEGPCLVLLLDGITDPQNLGAVCRSAAAFGADLVVLPEDRSARVTPAVARVSSGAVFHLRIAVARNLATTIGRLRESGFFVAGLDRQGTSAIGDAELPARCGICLGAEDRGIRKAVRAALDTMVRLPTDVRFPQLNAGSAAAAALYEYRRRHPKS